MTTRPPLGNGAARASACPSRAIAAGSGVYPVGEVCPYEAMRQSELRLFATLGLLIWLSGAVTFRFGGHLMFESGPVIVAVSAISIAVSVCLLLSTLMNWRKASETDSLVIAVVMALPGLFGDVAYTLAFAPITGLKPETASTFAAVVIFGNAALFSFALWRARPRG